MRCSAILRFSQQVALHRIVWWGIWWGVILPDRPPMTPRPFADVMAEAITDQRRLDFLEQQAIAVIPVRTFYERGWYCADANRQPITHTAHASPRDAIDAAIARTERA